MDEIKEQEVEFVGEKDYSVEETDNTTDVEVSEEESNQTTETTEHKPVIEDSENPLTTMNEFEINKLLQNVRGMVELMGQSWASTKESMQISNEQLKELIQFNSVNRIPMPENLNDDEKEKWDKFNGLDKMTPEQVNEIFPEGHPIIGVEHHLTIQHMKEICDDYYSYVEVMEEYKAINSAYLQLNELREQKAIDDLKAAAETETDPEKKEAMQKSIDSYYNIKYLDFLAEEMKDEDKAKMIEIFQDSNRVKYLLNRTRTKLKHLKISDKFILEISKFENRFLEEKYHDRSNMLLLYFMRLLVYNTDLNRQNDINRGKVTSMVVMLDNIVSNRCPVEIRERVLNNIRAMLDQLEGLVPTNKPEEVLNEPDTE